jgi:hypothetical protein
VRRNWSRPKAVFHARDLIGLFRIQHILPEMSSSVLIERIVSWKPLPEDGQALASSRTTVEREVSLAIYNQEEGTESMVCPPAWREAFEAADELRRRYAAVPDETLAELFVAANDLTEGRGGDHLEEQLTAEFARRGITAELEKKALGPDAEEISDDEARWRTQEILEDLFYGEQGYRVQQRMNQLMQEQP